MTAARTDLPASALIPELLDAVATGNVIVGAPPGAGKSTVLPLALLEAVDGRLNMLQPRRVVVRNLAAYLASQLGEKVGETVGYRIRGENKTSNATRLEIVTEGVLSRLIQNDPELTGVSLIIFDEFHERSLHSDFGLALTLEVQEGLRDDLGVIVMSATLDVDELKMLLPDAAVLKSEGRQFEVEEVYLGQPAAHQMHEAVARAVKNSVDLDDGDILVFLPGTGAIRRVANLLNDRNVSSHCVIHQLYGALTKERQIAAIQPGENGRRKVILATNVAETSLTIEGIRVVIDSGLENVATFHQSSGFTQLNTQLISQASATQRKGRAGRLGPGKVYRLWSKEQQDRLAGFPVPQIEREDITSLYLDALAWGTKPEDMALLTKPSKAQCNGATQRLQALDALDDSGSLTGTGRQIAEVPAQPAIAAMLMKAEALASQFNDLFTEGAIKEAACWIAAVAEENIVQSSGIHLSTWLQHADASTVERMKSQARRYAKLIATALKHSPDKLPARALSLCLAVAFPFRVAYRRKGNEYKLASGRGARLPDNVIEKSDWLVVLDGQVLGSDVIIRTAEPITEADLRTLFPQHFSARETMIFNTQKKQMEARTTEGFYNITLSSEPATSVSEIVVATAWYQLLEATLLNDWPMSEKDRTWWNRYQLACKYSLRQPQAFDGDANWLPADSPLSLLQADELKKRLGKLRRWEQLEGLGWANLCHQALPWGQQHAMVTFLPVSITVPAGENRKLVYRSDGEVMLAVKLQEMFGQTETVTVADGNKTVTIELLSPAGRPIQTTSDLKAFWQGSYFDVQKEMKGRYPKHRWPDDPMSEKPGRSIKPRNK